MTLVWTAQNGSLVRRGSTPQGTYPGYLPPILTRPTGADYVAYEDLVQGGDSVTTTTVGSQVVRQFGPGAFQTIIERCPANKWITFPAGVFEINTPGWNIGDNAACQWPKTSFGAIGNCPPGTGWDDLAPDSERTVFRVKANTAPAKNIAGGWFKVGYSGSVKQTWANIHFEGTEQGMQSTSAPDYASGGPGNDGTSHRLFTNFFAWNLADDSSARDILSTGNYGNNGAPPGETFNFQWYHSTGAVLCRVNADGRRQAGGPIYGSAGITFGNTLNSLMIDCYAHHLYQAGIVFFQTANCHTYGCILGHPTDKTTAHITFNKTLGCWFNHERTTGSTHTDTVLNVYAVNAATEHISHSNDSWTLSRSGQNIPIDNGTVKFINPTWSKVLFGGSGYPITYATWVPYWTGNTMTLANKPITVQTNGTTTIAAKWNYGGTWYDI